jgi:hypothetical protein
VAPGAEKGGSVKDLPKVEIERTNMSDVVLVFDVNEHVDTERFLRMFAVWWRPIATRYSRQPFLPMTLESIRRAAERLLSELIERKRIWLTPARRWDCEWPIPPARMCGEEVEAADAPSDYALAKAQGTSYGCGCCGGDDEKIGIKRTALIIDEVVAEMKGRLS